MKRMYAFLPGLLLAVLFSASADAQVLGKQGFVLGGTPVDRPTSNFINDIFILDSRIAVGTGTGLLISRDRGASWQLNDSGSGLGKGGISAIALKGDTIWTAAAFDTTTDLGDYEAGGGLSMSPDGGTTWQRFAQPVDARGETDYLPTTTVIQNITYDIALTGSAIWIASFGGGLRKSTDNGASWNVVTVDGRSFDAYGNLAHRAFAVHFDGEAVWAGTAAGIHKSLDGGSTWVTFNRARKNGISGNFVVAISHQEREYGKRIWASTIEALGEDEIRAVSYTDDGGLTWTQVLEGEFAHNFAFDPVSKDVYVAADNGLFKSSDAVNWYVFPRIVDNASGETILTSEFNCAAVENDQTLWAGSSDGMARTPDNGLTWQVFRAFRQADTGSEPATYAYPNPFSPLRHNMHDGDGHVRLQYRLENGGDVTVKIYDFAMDMVKNLVRGEYRESGDRAEIWNGRNDLGDIVANGVYFYSLEFGGRTVWGKVLVVN